MRLCALLCCWCWQAALGQSFDIRRSPVRDVRLHTEAIEQLLQDSAAVLAGNYCVLIQVRGQRVFSQCRGAMSAHTPVPLASASKWLSGAVILALVDEGKLSLDDTAGKYIPSFTHYRKGDITLRQLMAHTSGLPPATDLRYEGWSTLTLAQAVDSIAKYAPQLFAPGTGFVYGSVGMQVAGRMAEVATGKIWLQLFREKIATPCHMHHTDYAAYADNEQNPLLAGSARGTADDYMQFLQMLVDGGMYAGKRVLSEEAIRLMEANQSGHVPIIYTPYSEAIPYTQGRITYGIGMWRDVVAAGSSTAQELSSPGLFGAMPWLNRNKRIAGIILPFYRFHFLFPNCLSTELQLRQLVRDQLPDVP